MDQHFTETNQLTYILTIRINRPFSKRSCVRDIEFTNLQLSSTSNQSISKRPTVFEAINMLSN